MPNTIAVLIVTCPCALALATPVAAAIGVGRLADRGVLTVRSDALEHFARCETVAFDKTGTLTLGRLEVTRVEPFGDTDETTARQIAQALEADSEHPVGRALRALHDGTPDKRVGGLRVVVGEGVEGRVDDQFWRIGKPQFALNDDRHRAVAEVIEEKRRGGQMVVALANAAGSGALFTLVDRPRPGIGQLVADLRAQGVRHIALLSGDSQASTTRFAEQFSFDEILGDCTPLDKLAWIHAHQADGTRVAMVGDGINDAPTLAAADVSLSFAHATDLAQVHSGLLLLGDDPRAIGEVRRSATSTRSVIRQNLVWAASYNTLAVPAAALGLIPPWGAAIGMSLSSLVVVLNALRLRH